MGFLTSQLHASALSPLVCWTGTKKDTRRVSENIKTEYTVVVLFVLSKCLEIKVRPYLDEFVGWRFARVAFLL